LKLGDINWEIQDLKKKAGPNGPAFVSSESTLRLLNHCKIKLAFGRKDIIVANVATIGEGSQWSTQGNT
jgi:hypothetical protein